MKSAALNLYNHDWGETGSPNVYNLDSEEVANAHPGKTCLDMCAAPSAYSMLGSPGLVLGAAALVQ